METPRQAQFRMPAEWAPHARCFMAWPARETLWGRRLDTARRVTAEVARAIAEFEPVTMIARPEFTAGVSLYCGSGVAVLPLPQDDSWTRDTAPTFLVRDGSDGAAAAELAGVAWQFNGWGEAYEDHALDAQMARRLLERLGLPIFKAPIVLEGGAVHVDGEGTALVCEPSVRDPKRNPGLSRDEADVVLGNYLGVDRVIWLPAGLTDDETAGHVDNVACFAKPGTVLVHTTDDKADGNYAACQANLQVLREATDAQGRAFEIITLPQPRPQKRDDGRRLTLSYINFYLANGGLIMPAFGDPADTPAYRILSQAFPNRRVVQLDVVDLLQGGGGIHCITQQMPAVK